MLGLNSKFLDIDILFFKKKKSLIKKPDRFVYQVVVPKALAPKDLLQVYEAGDWVVLPPWDPMVRTRPTFFCYISGGIGMILSVFFFW